MQDAQTQPDVLNRPNSEGKSPFHVACSDNDMLKAMLLWTAGAKPSPDDEKSCEFLMKHANLHPLGIQHVVECPPLVDLLGNWSGASNEEKEAAEQKIKDLFSNNIKLIFIPTFHMSEEKRQELRRKVMEWNRGHTIKGEEFENNYLVSFCP